MFQKRFTAVSSFSKVSEYLYLEGGLLGLYVCLFVSLFIARTDFERIEIEVSHEFEG